MARPQVNLTGFDMHKLVTSSRSAVKDPWARMEQWRYTGPFTRFNRFKNPFPGLGIATVAFAAYCGYEYLFLSNDQHGHSDTSKSDGHH